MWRAVIRSLRDLASQACTNSRLASSINEPAAFENLGLERRTDMPKPFYLIASFHQNVLRELRGIRAGVVNDPALRPVAVGSQRPAQRQEFDLEARASRMPKHSCRILVINDEHLVLREFVKGLNAAARTLDNPLGISFTAIGAICFVAGVWVASGWWELRCGWA